MTHRRHLNQQQSQQGSASSWHVQNHGKQSTTFFTPQAPSRQTSQPPPAAAPRKERPAPVLPKGATCDIQQYVEERLSDIIMNTSTDRTNEFMSVVSLFAQRQKSNPQIRHASGQDGGKPGGGVATIRQRQEFNMHAKQIGKNLSRTFEKLEKLTLLCKKRTLFDDRPVEISELTHIIKQDIDGLKRSLISLENTSKAIPTGGRKDVANQTKAQIKELTSRIGTASKSFLNVMELRRDNIKIQNERREQFQGSSSIGPEGIRKRNQNQTGMAFQAFDDLNQNSVLARDEQRAQSSTAIDQNAAYGAMQQDQQLLQQENNYAQERAQNMDNIESAIVEIGQVMRQLGNMVAEQQETVMRIDSNIESAELSIENAHSEILKYFQSVTNNRWLMVKVFGTLVIFFIIFIVFFA